MSSAPVLDLDMAAEAYHAVSACSCSRLKAFAKSPAHMKAELAAPRDSDALRIGTAGHFAILQPDLFASRYVRGIDGDGRTTAVKEARKQLIEENPGKTVLAPAEFDCCLGMRDSVYRHTAASFTLERAGTPEMALFWDHPATGVRMKARIDSASQELGATIEIKTTRSAAVHSFERDIFNLKYNWQGSLYLDGAAQFRDLEWLEPSLAGLNKHIIIAVEKEAPIFACNVFALKGDAIDAGRAEIEALMPYYAQCLERDEWPLESAEYSSEFRNVTLPSWAWNQIDRRMEEYASV